ncbi:F390 synthetase-related protein [Cupriavidus sp. BIS7]|uniref:F390 synthetase-related protein n=1 Tax=Cupriavidus sp. BIS7 TaxID=1217718 RepID=UPI00036A7B00|nr:F390 synthetase-related protein [Cupriavidus sp. BIS7]
MTVSPRLLWSYLQARHLRLTDRAKLQAHQHRQFEQFTQRVLAHSPYFRPWLTEPLAKWPLMDKATMMANFDAMNTGGIKLDTVIACARRAELSRDFRPMVGPYAVGLSSGTSGGRGVFVVSPKERATWAGILLAKLLPRGLLHRERVALFLRANNNLYTTVRNPWLSFAFFDLFAPLNTHLGPLAALQPTIVVAPAQVLRALALERLAGRLNIAPVLVLSGAEVLEPADRELLQQAFDKVGEIYQATEGFLGATCPHGALHLNEAHVHIEPEWLDDRRFIPIITDFTRSTQPIVRYRLDDILIRRNPALPPCPCGNPEMAIERIEGRCDDTLMLPARDGGPTTIFADTCARALAHVLPLQTDYRLVQTDARTLALSVTPAGGAVLHACHAHLTHVFEQLGVDMAGVIWHLHPEAIAIDFTTKRRRIVRLWSPH